ncbi:MAG: response regulator transcription factor [Armatimonadota bacterium]
MPPIRIVIADDTRLLRSLLARQLSAEPDFCIVGQAADGREAVQIASELHPDVILMDLDMPHLSGAQATTRIRVCSPHSRVIVLTAHENLVELGRLAGAWGCLSKNCAPEELAATVRRAYLQKSPDEAGTSSAASAAEAVERVARRARLTEREKGVVLKVMDTSLTLRQVARALSAEWNEPVTETAVKRALERSLNKLGCEPRTRASLVKHVLQER